MNSRPWPTWEPLPLRCDACDTDWEGEQPVDVPVDFWVAHLRAIKCPNCQAGPERLLLRLDGEPVSAV